MTQVEAEVNIRQAYLHGRPRIVINCPEPSTLRPTGALRPNQVEKTASEQPEDPKTNTNIKKKPFPEAQEILKNL